jgi:hypothetical protein
LEEIIRLREKLDGLARETLSHFVLLAHRQKLRLDATSAGLRNTASEGHTLDPPSPDRSDLETDLKLGQRRIPCKEHLGGPAYAPPLLGPDGFPGVAEAVPAPHLDLAEHESPTPAEDDVELVAACADVCVEYSVAPQPVVEADASFGSSA